MSHELRVRSRSPDANSDEPCAGFLEHDPPRQRPTQAVSDVHAADANPYPIRGEPAKTLKENPKMRTILTAALLLGVTTSYAYAQSAPDPKATVTLTYAELQAVIEAGIAQSNASLVDTNAQAARQRAASGYAKIQGAFFPAPATPPAPLSPPSAH